MWDDLYADETEKALAFRAANPTPPKPVRVSAWSQAGELIAAPFKGVGQAGLQTARVAQTAVPEQVGNPLAMSAAEQSEMLSDNGITRDAMDADLRRGVEALRPDPVASTVASQFLQSGARVLTKVAGYGLIGGPVGAVVGTGLDEGATGYMEMRDRGVDTGTAAKAGAVRGLAIAGGVALPVAGTTMAQTLGLVALGGPGAFMAEQALTREILERANYEQIAQEYDPLDPMGLALSVAVPGAVGAALHRARLGRGTQPAGALDAMAQDADMVDAAHVAYSIQAARERALGDINEPEVANSHTRALDDAVKALDEGVPVSAADVKVDPMRAGEIIDEMQQRLRPVLDELDRADGSVAPARADLAPRGDEWSMPGGLDISQVMENARHLLGEGRTAQEAIADYSKSAPVSGLMQNALVAVQDFPRRIPELVEQYRAIDINRGGLVPPMDVLADAIERMAAGKLPEAPNRPLGRAEMVAREHPTLLVRMDEADQPKRSEDVVNIARLEAKQDLADSKAFQAAAECFLRYGA